MPETIAIRSASPGDAAAVRALLDAAQLPLDGIPGDLAHFLVADRDGTIVGAIGLEPYGDAALLRSAVVAANERGTGLGARLVTALLAEAHRNGARELVLLTTTAERWFPRFGFEEVAREAVPAALRVSAEFQGACPDTAVVMRLKM